MSTLDQRPANLSSEHHPAAYDVVVIGAGVAGTSAASAFIRAGRSVALIDSRAVFPHVFRAEKIGDEQMALFDRFGLGAVARAAMTELAGVWVHRFGRIVDRQLKREYTASYGDLVQALRAGLPKQVDFIIDMVKDVETSATTQVVELRDGRRLEGRLLVVATGLGEMLSRKVGIDRKVMNAGHSLAIGFDITRPVGDFPFPSLVWHSDRPADRMAYFSLFPIRDTMRANLFVYRGIGDDWSKAFRDDPSGTLHALLPGFEAEFGRVETGVAEFYPINLTAVNRHRQPGFVLVGDAFATSCPATGTGLHKALNDVDRLVSQASTWFDTAGMGLEKIDTFYSDSVKKRVDAHSLRFSLTERSMKVDSSPFWTARRLRRNLMRRGRYALTGLLSTAPGRSMASAPLTLSSR